MIRQTGKYVVCDRGNERSRMQIFTKNGHFVKKIAIRYIDIVAGLAITTQGTLLGSMHVLFLVSSIKSESQNLSAELIVTRVSGAADVNSGYEPMFCPLLTCDPYSRETAEN